MYRCNTAISTAESWTAAHWTEIAFPRDVRVNGTTVVDANGVANVPFADTNSFGVVKIKNSNGVYVASDNCLSILRATNNGIKNADEGYNPIVPLTQHRSVFYGLAAASGDTTQSSSSNAVGVYTENAKRKITDMIEPQFRKIAEVTTSNNQGVIYVDTDLNGDSFELTEMLIDFKLTLSSGNGRCIVMVNQPNSNPSNLNDLYDTIPNVSCENLFNSSNPRRNIERLWISGGRFFGVSQDGVMGSYSLAGTLKMTIASSGIIAVDKIRSIRTVSPNGYTFGDNSVITIYGR